MGLMWNQSSYSRKLPLRSRQNDVPHFIYEITLSLPCLLLERNSFNDQFVSYLCKFNKNIGVITVFKDMLGMFR
jgi:hypothetical protein